MLEAQCAMLLRIILTQQTRLLSRIDEPNLYLSHRSDAEMCPMLLLLLISARRSIVRQTTMASRSNTSTKTCNYVWW
jgi:hypothetical protein